MLCNLERMILVNSLKRLDKLLIRGAISKEEYLERIGAYETSKRVTMQTAEGIISFLESELNEAWHRIIKQKKIKIWSNPSHY